MELLCSLKRFCISYIVRDPYGKHNTRVTLCIYPKSTDREDENEPSRDSFDKISYHRFNLHRGTCLHRTVLKQKLFSDQPFERLSSEILLSSPHSCSNSHQQLVYTKFAAQLSLTRLLFLFCEYFNGINNVQSDESELL